jgi:hypothetical protein
LLHISARLSSLVLNALCWLTLLAGAATLVLALFLCVWSYSPLPCVDDWYFIHQYHSYARGELTFPALLWSIHNGHRIIIPHLFDVADLTVFRGTNRLLLACIFLGQSAHVWTFHHLCTRFGFFQGLSRRLALGFILFCLFSPVQRENFMCGWQIAYILPYLFGTVAFVAMAKYASCHREPRSLNWLVLCVLATTAGTYSLASGILIWPALLFQVAALRLDKRILFTFSGCTLIFVILRLLDRVPEESHALSLSAGHVQEVFSFFVILFSRSWSENSGPPGFIFVCAAILLVLVAIVHAMVTRTKPNTFRIALLCVCTFAILNAVMTALGRWTFGIAGRYETPSLVFWCGFGLLVLSYVKSFRSDYGLLVSAAVVFFICGHGLEDEPRLRTEARAIGEEYRVAQAALASRVINADAVRVMNMPVAWTFGELDFLARRKASLYCQRPTSLIGEQVFQHFTVRDTECAGAVEKTTWLTDEAGSGMVLVGWVRNNPSHGRLKWLIVADEKNRIVGFGSRSAMVQSTNDRLELRPGQTPWIAFVPAVAAKSRLFLYRMINDSAVCPIAVTKPLTSIRGPTVFEASDSPDLVPIWKPEAADTRVFGGTIHFANNMLIVRSSTTDTQLLLNSTIDLKQFQTLVFKAKFERRDSVELFFGQQVNGRGIIGFVPVAGKWIYAFAQVGRNPFWKTEAGSTFRFDPTGGLGIGTTTDISGIWGSRNPMSDGPDPFEFANARRQEP